MKPHLTSTLPTALAGTPLADQFRYWQGATGRRYLHKVFPIELAPDFRNCPVFLVKVGADGQREVVWCGVTGDRLDRAILRARAEGATEAHLHLLAESREEAVRIAGDLQAALSGGSGRVAA